MTEGESCGWKYVFLHRSHGLGNDRRSFAQQHRNEQAGLRHELRKSTTKYRINKQSVREGTLPGADAMWGEF
jgi:hypothetical protein